MFNVGAWTSSRRRQSVDRRPMHKGSQKDGQSWLLILGYSCLRQQIHPSL